ncbi:uncharacterized protein EI90DRAFT_1306026 [Cantharellus anzutake]|uniref:uncharacterized protein n=1 Tax=Cantharellus anzutake TaxID=1750568 RepID=UPI0019041732|nr:uncharacterized protein EI90DRAFT_1306026 [Cantharellus anzutake]KAF8342140.1 hypothetical protein EI90DRAFT_1306026 [Cantharellus anzutake]
MFKQLRQRCTEAVLAIQDLDESSSPPPDEQAKVLHSLYELFENIRESTHSWSQLGTILALVNQQRISSSLARWVEELGKSLHPISDVLAINFAKWATEFSKAWILDHAALKESLSALLLDISQVPSILGLNRADQDLLLRQFKVHFLFSLMFMCEPSLPGVVIKFSDGNGGKILGENHGVIKASTWSTYRFN